ncbi:hypothetical protein GGR51DRAFT_532259 [Nemania sp. FL0031]|nr:hypothetical protein GGR51DRAFT_532259 [Nemania sp. FL0031]
MDQPQVRKRAREEIEAPDFPTPNSCPDARPAKVQRRRYPDSGYYDQESPKPWNLLGVSLARRLIEHNRRTPPQSNFPQPITTGAQDVTATSEVLDLAQQGGPDLSNLRGYVAPDCAMALPHERSEHSYRSAQSVHPPATSTFYNQGLERRLANNGITLPSGEPLPHWHDIQQKLSAPVLEISLEKFQSFKDLDSTARRKGDITHNVMPFILDTPLDHVPTRDAKFNNLEPLIAGPVEASQPDLYYGSDPRRLRDWVRENLSRYIDPATIDDDQPILPNLFLGTKPPTADLFAATLQACYDGAIGARGMHMLQNHCIQHNPIYDTRPLSFSTIYHYGFLRIFAHHIEAPNELAGAAKYHMTMIGQYYLPGSYDEFRKGVTAFRNIRDLAREYRETLINEVNIRLYHEPPRPGPL